MSDETVDQDAMADEWAAAMEEQGDGGAAEAVDLDELMDQAQPVAADGSDPKLDVILDIPVKMTLEVGGTEIAIRDLLQLSQGSVVELDRIAGEPLDVRINGTLIAQGEVVVTNDRYGVRLTDVISPQERIRRLK